MPVVKREAGRVTVWQVCWQAAPLFEGGEQEAISWLLRRNSTASSALKERVKTPVARGGFRMKFRVKLMTEGGGFGARPPELSEIH